mmetsp:Transcript_1835/g.6034  ORF Transcript_1835/g.6034 Transcript_1835/m.6034 type:complete len:216 (+) Transcript_1835:180-827(+)
MQVPPSAPASSRHARVMLASLRSEHALQALDVRVSAASRVVVVVIVGLGRGRRRAVAHGHIQAAARGVWRGPRGVRLGPREVRAVVVVGGRAVGVLHALAQGREEVVVLHHLVVHEELVAHFVEALRLRLDARGLLLLLLVPRHLAPVEEPPGGRGGDERAHALLCRRELPGLAVKADLDAALGLGRRLVARGLRGAAPRHKEDGGGRRAGRGLA